MFINNFPNEFKQYHFPSSCFHPTCTLSNTTFEFVTVFLIDLDSYVFISSFFSKPSKIELPNFSLLILNVFFKALKIFLISITLHNSLIFYNRLKFTFSKFKYG